MLLQYIHFSLPKMFEFVKIHVSWSRDTATRSCGAQDGDAWLERHLCIIRMHDFDRAAGSAGCAGIDEI